MSRLSHLESRLDTRDLVAGMLRVHPHADLGLAPALADCIEACLACAQASDACADACLATGDPALGRCTRRALDCADLARTTAAVLSRQAFTDAFVVRTLLLACSAAAAACALECLDHAPAHEHCRMCAEACRACERACLALTQEHLE